METITKVETWLPIFSGFYGTIWETDNEEEMEVEYINQQRKAKGLKPITWDDIEWDYEGYRQDVGKGFTRYVGEDLKRLGFILTYAYQELRSPREYNFTNDSVNVEYGLTEENKQNINNYLAENQDAFAKYLKALYTSRSGFISHYSPNAEDWQADDILTDKHKLGSVLNFILLDKNGKDYEMKVYEDLSGNGYSIHASNYEALVGG